MRFPRLTCFAVVAATLTLPALFLRPHNTLHAAPPASQSTNTDTIFHDQLLPWLSRNCFQCHANGNHSGNFNLDSFKSASDLQAHTPEWDRALKDIRSGRMPPGAAKTHLQLDERITYAAAIQNILYINDPAHPDPGPASIHRLTRVEYANSIHDLLGIDFQPDKDFPADDALTGTARLGGILPITPAMIDQYAAAADSIADDAPPILLAAGVAETMQPEIKISGARIATDTLAQRAWRRPLDPTELDSLMIDFNAAVKNGAPLFQAYKSPLKAIFASSNFYLRGQAQSPTADPKAVTPLNEFDLASRLSYFLWSTTPDDELLNLAAHKQLRNELPAQIKRMLASPNAAALTTNFADQWLQLGEIETATPDKKWFPDFDPDLRHAMHTETTLFFNAIFREDRSVMDFLTADFTFVNHRLATFYGIPNISGDQFQRVSLAATPRRGILAHASILTLTSLATRTFPAHRGRYILENILNLGPPRAAQPGVNVRLLPNGGHSEELSQRQMILQHRTDPNCAGCHTQMDPLGFALENFDGIGKWRDTDAAQPIDPSGELATGEKFATHTDLINLLANQRRDQFLNAITEKMLAIALNRGIEPYDQPATEKIIAALKSNNFKFSTLITQVILSTPFQMQRGDPIPERLH